MKNLFAILMVLTAVNLNAQSKLPVAVLALDAAGVSESDSKIITDRLRTNLINSGKFDVFEREKMNSILEESGFQQSGCTSDECAVEVGKLIGVRLMLAGRVGKIGNLYTLSVRLIDVETGKVLRNAVNDCDCNIEEFLTESTALVVNKLIGKSNDSDSKKTKTEFFLVGPIVGFSTVSGDGADGGFTYGGLIGYEKMNFGRIFLRFTGFKSSHNGPISSNLLLTYERKFTDIGNFDFGGHLGLGIISGNVLKEFTAGSVSGVEEKTVSGFGMMIGIFLQRNFSDTLYGQIGYDFNMNLGDSDVSNGAILALLGLKL